MNTNNSNQNNQSKTHQKKQSGSNLSHHQIEKPVIESLKTKPKPNTNNQQSVKTYTFTGSGLLAGNHTNQNQQQKVINGLQGGTKDKNPKVEANKSKKNGILNNLTNS